MKIEQKNLLQTWRHDLNILMRSHYSRSISIRRMNYLLGIPVILISMAIASYIFFTINHNPDFWVKMIAGMLLLLSAILTSLQTFLKYSEQAENHRNASARYQSLHHSVDQLLAFPAKDESSLFTWCDKLRDRWDELNLEVPNVAREEIEEVALAEKKPLAKRHYHEANSNSAESNQTERNLSDNGTNDSPQ